MEGPRFCDTLRFRIFFVRLFASSLCKLASLRQNTRTTQLTLIKSRKPRQVTEQGIFHLQLVMVYREESGKPSVRLDDLLWCKSVLDHPNFPDL